MTHVLPTLSRSRLLAFLLAPLLLFGGCADDGTDGNTPDEEGDLVVATTGMIADAARNLLGADVRVVGLMGPGVDPHLYKATRRDLQLLSDADVILYNGLHLEGKMGDVLEKLARKKGVVAVADRLEPSKLLSPAEYEGAYDPHVWFDVGLWKNGVALLADTLKVLMPDHAGEIEENATTYLQALEELDQEVRREIATIPKGRRVLVTAHDAFGYFGAAYGIEVKGLQGISTLSEFGIADRNAMVDLIVERGVPAVFVESSVPRKNVEALIEGVGSRGHAVRIGGELFSDAMGEEGTPEGTYLGMVRANLRTIVEGLR